MKKKVSRCSSIDFPDSLSLSLSLSLPLSLSNSTSVPSIKRSRKDLQTKFNVHTALVSQYRRAHA